MKILFVNDCNGFEFQNPIAHLIQCSDISLEELKKLEFGQIGAGRVGKKKKKIMTDGNIEYEIISQGRKSDYIPSSYDLQYKLISGNY